MQVSEILPEDAPDPAVERWRSAERFPLPVVSLVSQPHLELLGAPGRATSTRSDATGTATTSDEISLTYTLWRHPDDRSDPRNLAELDERTRRSLDEVPPWPRPAWLVQAAERLRYPMLTELVRTSWWADAATRSDAATALRRHAEHILRNRFRAELGLSTPPTRLHEVEVSAASIEHGVPLVLDGSEIAGVRLDTGPFVFGLAADLGPHGTFSAVVPRDDLPLLDLAFRSTSVADLAAE